MIIMEPASLLFPRPLTGGTLYSSPSTRDVHYYTVVRGASFSLWGSLFHGSFNIRKLSQPPWKFTQLSPRRPSNHPKMVHLSLLPYSIVRVCLGSWVENRVPPLRGLGNSRFTGSITACVLRPDYIFNDDRHWCFAVSTVSMYVCIYVCIAPADRCR